MTEETEKRPEKGDVLRMAVDIVAAYVSNNPVQAGDVPDVISTVYRSLATIEGRASEGLGEPPKPAISVRKSVTPEYITCLEDGKKLKMLKRHLRAAYNMSPEEYRTKWGLPADYPMVAPNYAQQRSDFAKKIGLGRKKGQKVKRAKRAAVAAA
jgi:predicted transcriptional regulator